MSSLEFFLCIAGMFLVTYLPRVLPLFLFSGGTISPQLEAWLRYVPPAIFGALVCSGIFLDGESVDTNILNPDLFVSLIVLIIALKTKSLFQSVFWGTLIYGIVVYFGI
jgi:branched-subunit amino acid transport protein